MRKLLVILSAVLAIPLTALANGTAGPAEAKINPHTEKGNCDRCHVASEEDLNSWWTFSSTKKKMKMDLNALCRQCHGVDFGHGVGKSTKQNTENLPMDSEGKIACAITCHDMHSKSQDAKQNRFHLRVSSIKLCLSCHKK